MEKNDTILKPFVAENLFWIREPKQYTITDSLITIVSEPHTDLWPAHLLWIQQRQCSSAANENF